MTVAQETGIMEFKSDTSLKRVGGLKQEQAVSQSCASQAPAWGNEDSTANTNKRSLSNESSQADSEQDSFPLRKKIKTEPKDDYELAAEECARTGKDSALETQAESIPERWKYEQRPSASPVYERVPSFAAEECHQFTENCNQCVINESRQAEMEEPSLHRRRQIREFEQVGEEPLYNKVRVWKEKRFEKLQVARGLPRPGQRGKEDEAGFYQSEEEQESCDQATYEHYLPLDDPRRQHGMQHNNSREQMVVPHGIAPHDPHSISQRDQQHAITSAHHVISRRDQHVITSEHHVVPPKHMEGQSPEEESGNTRNQNFNYIRYLLTHNGESTIVSSEDDVPIQRNTPSVSPENQMTPTSMPVVLTSPGAVPQEYINGISGPYPRISPPHTQTAATKTTTSSKAVKKRTRQQATGSNFLDRVGKSRHESPTVPSSSKTKGNKKSFETGAESGLYQDDLSRGQFGQGSTILQRIDPTQANQDTITGEQYISDIQRPYCNIPDDHQVTHINGVMSLPATRETRYGITLGELKRRTGYPEFLTRVDLIAYVRQSKSAGRALLDKYNISTAGQKSRPTILSKMCENEARVLGDGISRMNSEYFPWKTLAKVASNRVAEAKDGGDGKVEQKLKAIQNTRTMLKEMYDLMVENKDIACMKTFEVASHTFGTANILNHLTIFDRMFAEYQNNLIGNSGERL